MDGETSRSDVCHQVIKLPLREVSDLIHHCNNEPEMNSSILFPLILPVDVSLHISFTVLSVFHYLCSMSLSPLIPSLSFCCVKEVIRETCVQPVRNGALAYF